MSITQNLAQALAAFDREVARDMDLRQLRDFYEEAKREGLAKKPEYDLPQLDTIGRLLFANPRE
jgi:hypothetical protein